eukprot:IDg9172t1
MSAFWRGCETCTGNETFKLAYERAQANNNTSQIGLAFGGPSNTNTPILRKQAMIYSRGYVQPSCSSLAISGALSGGAIGA